jgi:GntR family transcriptional repressor for pyruvate dehydrogenase complex
MKGSQTSGKRTERGTRLQDQGVAPLARAQPLSYRLAALAADRASPVQCKRLHGLCADMRSRVNSSAERAELDLALQVPIAECAQNLIFSVIVNSLIEPLRESLIPGRAGYTSYAPRPIDGIFGQHEAVVAAIGERDPMAARRAMSNHLKYAKSVLLRYPDVYPAP